MRELKDFPQKLLNKQELFILFYCSLLINDNYSIYFVYYYYQYFFYWTLSVNFLSSPFFISFTETNEGTLNDVEENIVNLTGMPSRAITTLTTSILLAMSSPSSTPQAHHLRKGSHPHLPGQSKKESHSIEPENERDLEMECDPADIHLTFTTGPYWPPSSYARKSGLVMSHITLDSPTYDLGLIDEHVSGQKQDWVYSNPWVIPWLSWHGSPVYSMIQNFSGIGAPNLQSFKRNEITWVDRLTWIYALLLDLVTGMTSVTPTLSLMQTPMLPAHTAAAAATATVVQSGPESVPWVM